MILFVLPEVSFLQVSSVFTSFKMSSTPKKRKVIKKKVIKKVVKKKKSPAANGHRVFTGHNTRSPTSKTVNRTHRPSIEDAITRFTTLISEQVLTFRIILSNTTMMVCCHYSVALLLGDDRPRSLRS